MATLVVERRGLPIVRAEVVEMHRLRAGGLCPAEIADLVGRPVRTVRRMLHRDPADCPVVPRPPTPQNAESRRVARARQEMRVGLRAGTLSLEELLFPVHPDVATMMLVDIAQMQWRAARATMDRLGRDAVIAKVNLLRCAGGASVRSRAWLVEYGSRFPAGVEREAA